MNPLINIAIKAAREAGRMIMQSFGRLDIISITEKKDNTICSNIDLAAEQQIINIIKKNYPKHNILSEESGEINQSSNVCWVIDPLDGTNNYIHGLPHFAISISVLINNKISHGVVYDPLRHEIFYASKGQGAYLNEKRIRTNNKDNFKRALLANRLSTLGDDDKLFKYTKLVQELVISGANVRRFGVTSLDLAYVACGRFDAYWEPSLKSWDVAAGALIAKEAGALVCDWQGYEDFIKTGNIVAANPKLLRLILPKLAKL